MSTFSIGTGEKAKANGARPEDFRHDYGKAGVRSSGLLMDGLKLPIRCGTARFQRYPFSLVMCSVLVLCVYITIYIHILLYVSTSIYIYPLYILYFPLRWFEHTSGAYFKFLHTKWFGNPPTNPSLSGKGFPLVAGSLKIYCYFFQINYVNYVLAIFIYLYLLILT